MSKPTRWAILGAGNIARKFAEGLGALPEAELLAVGSRSQDKADAFATQFGIARRYDSYEALVADPDIEIVYVATPHPQHRPHSQLCLNAGKAVLCEKPFAVNAAEAAETIELARRRGLFLMEAMWTRFLPIHAQVREWLAVGAIGEPRLLTADFGFRGGWNPDGRLLNPALAGGSLLDVGIYCIAYASMVFGCQPTKITGLPGIGETGVDEQAAFVLGYDRGELALLASAVRTSTPHLARIDGTEGRITAPAFWHGTQATLERPGQEPETVELPLAGNGYNYQAAEAMACLAEGRLESDRMPLDETVANLQIADELRRQWGLRYPFE